MRGCCLVSGAGRTEKIVSLFLKDRETADRGSSWSVRLIPLDRIVPRECQPRKSFDPGRLESLAASIKKHGVREPILVQPVDGGNYEIVFGERRWRAAGMAGLESIPCMLVEDLSESEIRVLALTENIQRQDLTAMEKAVAIKDLIETARRIDGRELTLDEVGSLLGISRARVCQYLAVFKLPEDILEKFLKSNLNEMHTRALTMLKGQPEAQKALFIEITGGRLTGQQALERAKRYLASLPKKTPFTGAVERTRKTFAGLRDKLAGMSGAEKKRVRVELESLSAELDKLMRELDPPV